MSAITFDVACDLWNNCTRRLIGVTDGGDVVEDFTAVGGAATAAGAPLALNAGARLANVSPAFYAKHAKVAEFLRRWAAAIGEPAGHDMRTLFDQACRVPVGLGGSIITPLGGVAAFNRVPLSLSLVRWHDLPGMPIPPEVVKVQTFLLAWADALDSKSTAVMKTTTRKRTKRPRQDVLTFVR